ADDLLGVPRGADAARTAAGDEHRVGVELAECTHECRVRVLPAPLLDDHVPVADARVARVHVAVARRDVDPRPVAERVARVVDLEHPRLEARIVLRVDAVVEPRAALGARPLVEAPAAALEEDDELRRVGAAEPIRVRAAAGTRRLAAGLNALPCGGGLWLVSGARGG